MRKQAFTFVITLSLMLLACSPARAQLYSNAVMALHPVAYWPLQETIAPPSGAYTAANLGTSGAAANGYYQTWFQPWDTGTNTLYYQTNNIQHDAAGAIADGDTALQCTRSTAGAGGYVVFPRATNGVHNAALDIKPPFSIEFWVKPSSVTSAVMPIINQGRIPTQLGADYNYAATNWTGFSIGQYGTILFFATFNGTGGDTTKQEIDMSTLAQNQWQHLVVTFNGTNQTWFKNGAQTGTRTIPATAVNALGQRYVPDPTSPLLIGTGSTLGAGNGGSEFAGSIDEVAIYPQILDATTIANHYAARTATDDTYKNTVLASNPTIYVRLGEPVFPSSSYPNPSTYPVANNYGSVAAAAKGYYQPGTVPGVAGPALPGFGSVSRAVAINGFSGAVDVGAGSLPAVLNPVGAAPLTVLTWFQANPADAPARFQEIVSHGNNSWRLAIDATAAGARFNPGAGPELQFTDSSDILANGFLVNDGQWHFAAGVSDGTNDYLYLDGVLAKSGTSVTTLAGSTVDALLGGSPSFLVPIYNGTASSEPRYFNGQVSQVAYFTNALSSGQISQLYAVAGGPPTIQQQSLTDIKTFAGTSPTLRVTATGPRPISYQWSRNGLPISGATASAWTVTNAQANATYTCAITNSAGPASPSFNPISLAVVPAPTAPYPAAVLGSSPIAYFRLAESPDNGSGNNGTTAYDNAGGFNAVYDNVLLAQSGYNTVTEPSALSVEFGDYPPNNDYAGNVPTYLNFGTVSGNAQFSVEAWITQYFYTGGGNAIVALGFGAGGEQFVLDTGGSGGALRFFVHNAAGTGSAANSSFIPSIDGKWHHVVGVCNQSAGHVYLYLDGALTATGNITPGSGLLNSTLPMSIGARESAKNDPVSYDYQFIGKIDDVAVYNRALSGTEVQNHYLASGIAPVVTLLDPVNLTTNQGATAVFTATVVGTAPLSYQWSDPGSNPIGQNTNTLTLANLQTSQSGMYTLTVMNSSGSASTNFYLTVQEGAPQLVADLMPAYVKVYAGDPVTLSWQVSGSQPLTYRWYQNSGVIGGAPNANSYTITALLGTNTYQSSVSNSFSIGAGGPLYSSMATVVAVQPPTVNPDNFTAKLKISFAGYNRGETLRDFPALVKLGTNVSGFAYSQFASPTGGDLRFADASGTRSLPYEIDEWNGSNGLTAVWVQVPRLSGTNDYIWAYWGNPLDTTPPAYATNGATWLPAAFEGLPPFQIVYHLKESALPFADGTLQHPATNGVAPIPSAGIVGTGASFGGSKWLDAGTNDLGDAFTLSAWVNIPTGTSDIDSLWVNKVGGFFSNGVALYVNTYKLSDQKIDLATGDGTAGNESTTATGTVPFGSWHLVTAAVNRTNGTAQFYLDGDSAGSSSSLVTDFNTRNDLRLGQYLDGVFDFRGSMDEARVQSGVASSNWVWASWATVAQNSAFASYSSVTSLVVTLRYTISGNNLILNWDQGTLQSASPLNGGFSDLTGVTPPYTNQMTGTSFFRVRVH